MHDALEAIRRVGSNAMSTARVSHAHRVEGRGLKDEIGGGVGDACARAALHARERNRAVVVGDHEVGRREFDLLRVGSER
jgi:hypothetical protein